MSFFVETLEKIRPVWEACVNSPFIREMQCGTLKQEKFCCYMLQDVVYLKHYARVIGMAIYRSESLNEIQMYYEMLGFVGEQESAVRLDYLRKMDMEEKEAEYCTALKANQNYIDFLEETASGGDSCELLMAVLPCMLSYSYIFQRIAEEGISDSAYRSFIEDYADEEYGEDCRRWGVFAEEKCGRLSEEKKEKLYQIFERASLLELDFWHMAEN